MIALWLTLWGTTAAAHRAADARVPLYALAEANGLPWLGITDADFGSRFYRNTVPREFNSITSEDVFKFAVIHPCPPPWLIDAVRHPDTFNASVAGWVTRHGTDHPDPSYHCSTENAADHEWEWGAADARIAFAEAHGMGLFAHTLLWHVANPEWLTDPAVSLSVVERERLMEEHIRGAVRHFGASSAVYGIDVVNEAIAPDGSLLPLSPWVPIPDYIHQAFVIARSELDGMGRQDVALYYNDFEIEYGYARYYDALVAVPGCYRKSDAVVRYLKRLLDEQGTPIDGVGFQTHLVALGLPVDGCNERGDVWRHDTARMKAMMRRFGALGLEVRISEIDVARRGDVVSDEELERIQARSFSGALAACLELPGLCMGYTVWGTHDGKSWYSGRPGFPAPEPLLFSDPGEGIFDPEFGRCVDPSEPVVGARYCPKAGYHAIRALLIKTLLETSTVQFPPLRP